MKTQLFSRLARVAMLFGVISLSGCGMLAGGGGNASMSAAHSSSLVTGEYDRIQIPALAEYEVLGMVFASTEEYVDIDRPYLTYLELLKKAAEMGGHAIVNVSIEDSRNCVKLSFDEGPYKKKEKACKIKRFGSALAIKYTNIIKDGPLIESVSAEKLDQLVTSVTESSQSTQSSSPLSLF